MKNRLLLTIAIVSVLGVTGVAVAQAPGSPTAPGAVVPAASPAAPAAFAAPSVAPPGAPSAPLRTAPQSPLGTLAPSAGVVPGAAPIVDLGNLTDTTAEMPDDDLLRVRSRLSARRDLIKAQQELDQAILARQQAQVEGQIKLMELRTSAANGGKKPEEVRAQQAAAVTATAVAAVQAPQPVVRSIYGFGENAYAEIYIGNNKILANRGTVLDNGQRVVDFTANGVVLVDKRGRRETLRVRGSAGTAAPSASAPAAGLPPFP